MTTTVSVSVSSTPLTWANAAFPWTDFTATTDEWSAANVNTYTLAVSESWQTAEAEKQTYSQGLIESWHTTEIEAQSYTKPISEGWTTGEALVKAYGKALSDAWVTAESIVNARAQFLYETITTSESISENLGHAIAESWTTSEVMAKLFSRPLAEAFTSIEALTNSTNKASSESWTTTESAPVFGAAKGIAESWKTNETWADQANFHLGIAEHLSTLEAAANGTNKAFSESVTTAELYDFLRDIVFMESWTTSEVAAKWFGKTQAESVTTGESVGNQTGKTLADGWSTSDANAQSFNKLPLETLTTGEALAKVKSVSFAETVETQETPANSAGLPFSEAWQTSETEGQAYSQALAESIMTLESFGRVYDVAKVILESVTMSESLANCTGMTLQETITLLEDFIRRANAIISDILASTGDISDADFTQLLATGSAPGFEAFAPFVAGDYQYDEALFKEVLQSFNGDRPSLSALAVQVDVPDVTDSGSATSLSTGDQTVTFARKFITSPEVHLTIKMTTDSSVVIPRVTSISNEGFTFNCTDTSGNLVAATVSWSATGY